MGRRKLTGVQLAADIGLSATSLSRIVTGHSKPKQVTLTRLMKRLCGNPQEEQMLLRAFTGRAVPVLEAPITDDPLNAREERERVERWLEARTQAITFKNAVARELEKTGLNVRRDVCEGIGSADFLVEHGHKRIGIECKFNVSRDFEKTVGVARLLRTLLRCDSVVVVVPFLDAFAEAALADAPAVLVQTPAELVTYLEKSV